MLLHGIFPPITTPFYPDGKVYFKKLEHNVDRYSRTPIAGIVVLGSTGEAVMLSDQERREVLKCAREFSEPEKVLVAGTGVESAVETLRLTEYAAELGYDVAMVRTPHYYKRQMQPVNILAFYRTVADQSPLPVIIYNFPQATGYDIPVEVVTELAEHPNVIGIKESSGDVAKVKNEVDTTRHVKRTATVTEIFNAVTPRMMAGNTASSSHGDIVRLGAVGGTAVQAPPQLKTRYREVGFQVLVGSAQTLKDSLDVGAVGAILAFSCAAPTASFEIYAAWKEGDAKLAFEKQARVVQAATKVVGEYGVPGVKHAMDLNGYYGGPSRLPLLPLTADVKQEIERLMADIRN
ncbi:MAG: dihydrodipicolinate synthase family protein [Acidobacteria bacterium]|nr:dihydrodipicolinate synthase family protein [Acidobacteriota bacterium]